AAPGAAAFEEGGNDAGLGTSDGGRGGLRRVPQRARRAGDDDAAAEIDEMLLHPAFGALGIPHLPPGLLAVGHLERPALALEHPLEGIAGAGADAEIDLVGPEADEARPIRGARGDRQREEARRQEPEDPAHGYSDVLTPDSRCLNPRV